MNFKKKTILWLATSGGLGRLPVAPGTFGSIPGLFFSFLLSMFARDAAGVVVIALMLGAIWVSEHAERVLEAKDPGSIVIDEVVGMMVTMLGLPFNFKTAILGFVFFRIFDILKPSPVRNIQDGLPGGTGVVMDDVAAGVMANILLHIVYYGFGLG